MIPNSPIISVIIPSFNQGEFIEETIMSLIRQNYPNLEIIVIDGGSKDQTVNIIKKYETHITYWVSEEDSGQSEAINKGFNRATGDIMTWLNSDDYYEQETLQKVAAEFVSTPYLSILHGKSILFGQSVKEKVIGLEYDIPLYDYFPFMRFPQPSCFIKTEVLKKVLPVNNALHYAMDFELIIKIILKGGNIKRSNEIFSHYRLHKSSKSNEHGAFLKEWTFVVGNFFNSVSGGQKYIETLIQFGLLQKPACTRYATVLTFTDNELECIFLQHLNICYHYSYREFNKKICAVISSYLKTNANAFYTLNGYKKYNNRLKFIPKFAFKFIRSLLK